MASLPVYRGGDGLRGGAHEQVQAQGERHRASLRYVAQRPAPYLLVLLLWPGLAGAQTPAPPPSVPGDSTAAPLTLDDALTLARSNPSITAARLRRAVDRAGIDVAGERPNPEARYEHTNELPRDAISVAQLVELGGKRGRRIDLARAVAASGEAEIAQTEAEVAAETYLAFYGLVGAQRRLEVARELQQIASRARSAAAARLEVGDVSRLDVLQADLALYEA
jgi:cobalt-zinc-cadmium efflux system outer membrane protein